MPSIALSISFSFFRRRHILRPYALEYIAENGKLAIGRRARRLGGSAKRVDRAHGRCTHQGADCQKCHLTYHCLPFPKTSRVFPPCTRIDRLTVFSKLNVERWTLRGQRQSRRAGKSCRSHGGQRFARKHELTGPDRDCSPFRQEPRGVFPRVSMNHDLAVAPKGARICDPGIRRVNRTTAHLAGWRRPRPTANDRRRHRRQRTVPVHLLPADPAFRPTLLKAYAGGNAVFVGQCHGRAKARARSSCRASLR
jgi:hypothetical protein